MNRRQELILLAVLLAIIAGLCAYAIATDWVGALGWITCGAAC